MSDLIRGRDGELILPAEYSPLMWARVGERLDAIAAEGEPGSEPCS